MIIRQGGQQQGCASYEYAYYVCQLCLHKCSVACTHAADRCRGIWAVLLSTFNQSSTLSFSMNPVNPHMLNTSVHLKALEVTPCTTPPLHTCLLSSHQGYCTSQRPLPKLQHCHRKPAGWGRQCTIQLTMPASLLAQLRCRILSCCCACHPCPVHVPTLPDLPVQ